MPARFQPFLAALAVLAVAFGATVLFAREGAYPAKPITIIVLFSAGAASTL